MTAGRPRVGCSGWMYKHWKGPVYPPEMPQRRWFGHYASILDTVEVNNTFYRLPTESAVEGWAAQAPPDFVYALKLGSFGSHRMKLKDAASWLPNHVDRVERLGHHAGPTLVQLPPRWRRNADRLDELLSVAPKTHRWAVELREPSWLHEETYDVLRRHGAALCIHDLLADVPWELTADWTYWRFHGPDALERAVPGSLRARGPVLAGRAHDPLARPGPRRLRLLQQRRLRLRRPGRPLAGRPAPRRLMPDTPSELGRRTGTWRG